VGAQNRTAHLPGHSGLEASPSRANFLAATCVAHRYTQNKVSKKTASETQSAMTSIQQGTSPMTRQHADTPTRSKNHAPTRRPRPADAAEGAALRQGTWTHARTQHDRNALAATSQHANTNNNGPPWDSACWQVGGPAGAGARARKFRLNGWRRGGACGT
jgi:hypothetical protein